MIYGLIATLWNWFSKFYLISYDRGHDIAHNRLELGNLKLNKAQVNP